MTHRVLSMDDYYTIERIIGELEGTDEYRYASDDLDTNIVRAAECLRSLLAGDEWV